MCPWSEKPQVPPSRYLKALYGSQQSPIPSFRLVSPWIQRYGAQKLNHRADTSLTCLQNRHLISIFLPDQPPSTSTIAMSAVHTFPRHTTNARGSTATSFLSEHAEIERIITHNFKANPHMHAKVFADPFSPSESKQSVYRTFAESQPRREFDGSGHRIRPATTSLQYPPKSPAPVVLSPTSVRCAFFLTSSHDPTLTYD